GPVGEAELLAEGSSVNCADAGDGILMQLPLPRQIEAKKVIDAIDPAKDVDGFHPMNVGLLHLGRPVLVPCTPSGVMRLIDSTGVPVEGKRAVVIGRSDIVGKPVAALLLQRNATVTVCHSRTRELAAIARQAEILVAAIGKARFVTAEMIRPGAVIIDDAIVADLYRPGEAGHETLVRTYGAGILSVTGEIDRRTLSDAAFATPEAARRLNALIHPLVLAEERRMIAAMPSNEDRIVIVEA